MVEGIHVCTREEFNSLETKIDLVDKFKIRFKISDEPIAHKIDTVDEVAAKEEAFRIIVAYTHLAKANTAVIDHQYLINRHSCTYIDTYGAFYRLNGELKKLRGEQNE